MRLRRVFVVRIAVVVVLILAGISIMHIPESDGVHMRAMLTPNAFRPFFTHEYRRLILPSKQLCKSKDQFLAIIVHSAPDNSCKRNMIRQTWGSHQVLAKVNATLTFVMGVVKDDDVMAFVQDEADHYGDILQEDYIDTYYNLTHKAVAWMKWVTETCQRARYVIKTDDDILTDVIQVKRLLQTFVEPLSGGRMTMACNYWTYAPVDRSMRSKWQVTKEEFAASQFGSMCQGSAYVMSMELVSAIYPLTLTTPFFKLDDVYVTGFLVQQFNITVYPWNERYATNYNAVASLLSGTFHVPPLFAHSLPKEDYFRLWSHMKSGECCPRSEPNTFSLWRAIFGHT